MKKLLLMIAAMSVGSITHSQITLVPNGDFEAADDSLTWVGVDASGDIAPVTFATGGNLGGYGSITPNGGWGILVNPIEAGNVGGGVPITNWGLAPLDPVTFTLDMISLNLGTNVPGAGNVGGMKIEAWGANAIKGNTGDIRPALIGNGSTWESYTINWTVPAGTDKFIFVPLWEAGLTRSVGFDNIGAVGVPEPSTFALLGGMIALGVVMYRRRRK